MESLPQAMLQQIADVAAEKEETLTPNQVAAVLAAREAILEGAPVGTIMKGSNGEIAVRVNDAGFHMWRVTCTDGTFYNDTQPNLPAEVWTKV